MARTGFALTVPAATLEALGRSGQAADRSPFELLERGAGLRILTLPSGFSKTRNPSRAILLGMEQRISLVTFGVRDLARARAFYEALGWTGARQPDDEVAFFQAAGMVFGLWTKLGGHGAPGVELAHNVRSPEEVDAVLAEAAAAGGAVVRPAKAEPWGGTSGAFADPEGYVWEVAHNPDWAIAPDGSVTLG